LEMPMPSEAQIADEVQTFRATMHT
jgi:hypothetical protein